MIFSLSILDGRASLICEIQIAVFDNKGLFRICDYYPSSLSLYLFSLCLSLFLCLCLFLCLPLSLSLPPSLSYCLTLCLSLSLCLSLLLSLTISLLLLVAHYLTSHSFFFLFLSLRRQKLLMKVIA